MISKEDIDFIDEFIEEHHSEIFEYPKKHWDGCYEIVPGIYTGERGLQNYLKACKEAIKNFNISEIMEEIEANCSAELMDQISFIKND